MTTTSKWQGFIGEDFFNKEDQLIVETILRNELGGVSTGYTIDHAEPKPGSNSGFSFGGNQMDLGVKTTT